ncbi:carbohydrate-binding module family 1 protein [Serendipita vermifera MAFF 305830]|uniref:Carboxylic ester hydrolase n=1 Tax=Serendipita vermifera MAFF 305830 TaxID=933852 RepID=A0A0C2XZB1_SERVB|nr:carbohydrate-binding module family 1 protein [Serendipita vermifera MAFF 305830]
MLGFLSFVATALLGASSVLGAANQLQQVTANIGANPNNVGFYVYKPTKLANPTPLIVAIHYCTGSAQAYFTGSQYANLADTYGFIVVYPDSPRSGKCFDVASAATLKHDGGGDSQGIASMIKYAIANYGVSASRVFVTGTSSGAMMTQVLAGSYPDLFQAASAYNGVPFACFAGTSDWNSACANGQISKTAAQWGDLVRAAYPGYTGARPKMMLWHGTVDTTLSYNNYGEALKQWSNVLGVSQTATASNDPQSGYTKSQYACSLIGYSAAGVGHTVPIHESIELAWFGITSGGVSGCSATTPVSTTPGVSTSSTTRPASTSSTPVTPVSTTSSPTTGGTAAHWAQCGGIGYTGPTTCASPYTVSWHLGLFRACS